MIQLDTNCLGKIKELIQAQREDYNSRIKFPSEAMFLSDMTPYAGWDVLFDERGNVIPLESTGGKKQASIHVEYMFNTYIAMFSYMTWGAKVGTVARPNNGVYQGDLEGILKFIRKLDRKEFRFLNSEEIDFANEECEKRCKNETR